MTFASELTAFVNKNQRRSTNFYRRVAVAGLAGMERVSPFDTGAFRGDWGVTEGSENNATESPYSLALTGKEDIYIRNTKAYAEKLEHGLSDQAPNGIIRVVAKELKFKIEAGLFSDR